MRTPILQNELSGLMERVRVMKGGFDLINDPVVITDIHANILYANKATETVTGFSTDEMINKNPGDLWGGQMTKEFYEKMWQTIKAEKKPFVGEVHNKKKDGTLYWQELHVSPILDDKGEVRFFISIEPNITDKKEKEQFKEEFISIVGHQLRNPLTTIGLLVELLSKSKTLTAEDREILEDLYSEDKNLSGFVADLLTLSRIGAGTLVQDEINLRLEIEHVIKEVRARDQNVEIIFESSPDDFPVTTSKTLAYQVFSNLIYNASEYSAGKVKVTLKKEESSYLFSCYNNGPEIKEEDKPKIFSKFFRSDLARVVKKGGTGLGLYIVKSITDEFKWDVWFESGVDKGTTFYVRIPIESNT